MMKIDEGESSEQPGTSEDDTRKDNVLAPIKSEFVASILETSECIAEKINMQDRVIVKKTPMIYSSID